MPPTLSADATRPGAEKELRRALFHSDGAIWSVCATIRDAVNDGGFCFFFEVDATGLFLACPVFINNCKCAVVHLVGVMYYAVLHFIGATNNNKIA